MTLQNDILICRKTFLKLVLLALCSLPLMGKGQVMINEIMSSNGTALYDEDGNAPDWIELWNASDTSYDLTGVGLSDDPAQPFKWRFPSYIMAPRQYLVVFASDKNRLSPPLFYETVIRRGDTCKYLIPNASTPTVWRSVNFNDSSWPSGISGFGYGDGDDTTILPNGTLSVFIRKTFYLSDPSAVKDCWLHMDYDDGFVAYLNEKEIARAHLGTPGIPPAWNATADAASHEAVIYQGGMPDKFQVHPDSLSLLPGKNVLAIQVHNTGTGSSDMTAIPFLTFGFSEPVQQPRGINALTGIHNASFHTNFKISSSGDTIILTSATNTQLDFFVSGALKRDISAGKQPDGEPGYWLFSQPTPWKPNTTKAYPATAMRNISFSHPGGIFSDPFELIINGIEAGDSIFYSLDGKEPSTKDSLYTHPIIIDGNTVVRARLYNSNLLPGKVHTVSFIRRIAPVLPQVSIVTDPYNLLDYHYGIYEMGPHASPDFPFFGANFWQDWERPVHIDLFETDTSKRFSAPAGIKIYGNYSRGNPQKSFAIFARGEYGAKEFAYSLFPNLPYSSYQAFVLRNSGNDWNISQMRDGLMTSLVAETGLELQAYRPTSVYINGQYWGILNLREKINEHFLAAHGKIDPHQIDLLEFNGNVIHGDADHYWEMINFISTNSLAIQKNYEIVKGMMDIKDFIDYQIAEIFYDNWDWPGNNLKYWRPKTNEGKWRWILFDTDFGFGLWTLKNYQKNTLAFALETDGPSWPNPPWSTFLFRNLLLNNEFKIDFVNRFADMMNSLFAYKRVQEYIDRYADALKNEMPLHFERWGGNIYQWNQEISNLKTFALYRPYYMRQHIRDVLAPAGHDSLRVTVNDASAGMLRVNTLFIKTYPWSGIYFKNIPIPVVALPFPGFRFVRWEGPVANVHAVATTVTLTAKTTVKAIFEPDPSGIPPVIINEINYHSPTDIFTDDWIELYNPGFQQQDISQWVITDDDTSHRYVIPEGTIVPAHGYLILCRNLSLFRAIHSTVTNILGNLNFGLSGIGDYVMLYNQAGMLVDSVCYGTSYPWPEEPDGDGPTLELTNPFSDNAIAENWNASRNQGGTPGSRNSMTEIPAFEISIKTPEITEIYPNPATDHVLIRFTVYATERIRITIHDVHGRPIRILSDEEYLPGNHDILWMLSSEEKKPGIYLVNLTTSAGFRIVKRVVLTP